MKISKMYVNFNKLTNFFFNSLREFKKKYHLSKKYLYSVFLKKTHNYSELKIIEIVVSKIVNQVTNNEQ